MGGRNPRDRRTTKSAGALRLALAGALVIGVGTSPLDAAASPGTRAVAQRLADANRADRPRPPARPPARPRVIVTSDVEIDDVASWHRFWLYANEFDLEGLVYSSSRFHWAGDPAAGIPVHDWAGNDVLEQMLKGYGPFGAGGGYAAVYPSLRRHGANYPTPAELLGKIRLGNIGNIGEMAKDTPGSELIKAALLGNKPGPLYLQAWGGTNTIAAALRSIEDQYGRTPQWRSIYDKVVRTARVYIILDQDATYKDYIAKKWPDLYVIYNRDMFWSVAYPQFRDTRTPAAVDAAYLGADFMKRIVRGPLLQTYPLVTVRPGQKPEDAAATAKRIGWLVSEGDSPAYWHLLSTGLRSDEDPSFGGWGGRFAKVGKTLWTDRPDALGLPGARVRDTVPGADTDALAEAAPQTRWIPALQNDFLARSRWTEVGYEAANHEPVVRVERNQRDRSVRPGQQLTLSARAADPDGDRLDVRWWQYREAGSYAGEVRPTPVSTTTTGNVDRLSAGVAIPADAKPGDTIHVIAEVSDQGTPTLTRYARFVLTVR